MIVVVAATNNKQAAGDSANEPTTTRATCTSVVVPYRCSNKFKKQSLKKFKTMGGKHIDV